jgi:pyrimidine operon attenuation protein/uracil phosphoribosyltransferase
MRDRSVILSGASVKRALARMAGEMAERNKTVRDLVLVGVQTGGASIARRLAALLAQLRGRAVPVGTVDVSMHRDDVGRRATVRVHPTSLPFDLSGKTVILVDDVLHTGRTTRAALDALHDFGRPDAVQLAVMIDRGCRELPIKADFVGKTVSVKPGERVEVVVTDGQTPDSVTLEAP